MKALRAQNITKSFGGLDVLSDVSLEFLPGTVSAIVGDNGAGKSTFLKILAGIHKPDTGTLHLGSEDITDNSAQENRGAGIEMVYQDLALAKRHDVVTNLFLGRESTNHGGFIARSQMRRRAQGIIEQLGITIPNLDRPVGLLSGGQQQAIAIARAIMFDPAVVILDEPTAALAAREVERTLELIRAQRNARRVIILVSHRLNDVFAVSDRIIVFKHGRVFADDACASTDIFKVVAKIVS
jgi:ABC-type sugar transport system ATPase subunit